VKKPRKHCTAEEKVAILRPHLLEGAAVSALCDELGLQPTVFYRFRLSRNRFPPKNFCGIHRTIGVERCPPGVSRRTGSLLNPVSLAGQDVTGGWTSRL
jgi:hypothetical protein